MPCLAFADNGSEYEYFGHLTSGTRPAHDDCAVVFGFVSPYYLPVRLPVCLWPDKPPRSQGFVRTYLAPASDTHLRGLSRCRLILDVADCYIGSPVADIDLIIAADFTEVVLGRCKRGLSLETLVNSLTTTYRYHLPPEHTGPKAKDA